MIPKTGLRVCGISDMSTIDWYGKVSAVVFCAGCNFKCPYCQNSSLIPMDSGEEINLGFFKDRIMKNKFTTNSVVFTGGEPTLQPDAIIEFAKHSKSLGLKVMLDTNGSLWKNMKDILYSGYIDRVALDVKAPLTLKEYSIFSDNPELSIESVEYCLELVSKLGLEMEVRTTIAPTISDAPNFVRRIANYIGGRCDDYYLQQFDGSGDILDPKMKGMKSPSRDEMVKFAQEALSTGLKNVFIKTRLDGLEKIN